MTPAQLTTVVQFLRASVDPAVTVPLGQRNDTALAAWLNAAAAPAFTVWKSSVSLTEVGRAMDGAEAANLTTANNSRLQVRAAFMAQGETPSNAGTRAFYADVFSTGGVTAAALLALWKRSATRAEQLFATGTGSLAAPATLIFEGVVQVNELSNALNIQ